MSFLTKRNFNLRYCFIGLVCLLVCLSYHNVKAQSDQWVKQKDRVAEALSTRIVGGTVVPSNERTFQVALLSGGQLVCGGAIIADSWVLTTAHCVEEGVANQILSGTHNLNQGGQRHGIAQTIMHPNYTGNIGNGYDVALIEINGTFASGLERLKLATPEIMASDGSPGTGGIVSGWGATSSNGNISNRLKQTDNTIISDSECRQLAGNIDSGTIICANDRNKSSCDGDSGGPFTVTHNGQSYSAGIVSFGPVSCRGYSAYSETSSFLDWIAQYTDSSGGGSNELENNTPVTLSGAAGEDKDPHHRSLPLC